MEKQNDRDASKAADEIDQDDPKKVEKLSKLGHEDDDLAEGTE
jgi:hypothetical protein